MAVTETFTGANFTSPPNGNWTNQNAVGIQIISNTCASGTDGAYGFGYYSGITFANDQYAFCTILLSAAGPSVRASADNCYWMDCNDSGGTNSYLWERVGGSLNLLQTLNTTFNGSSDVARLEISGSTLRCYKNGVQIGSDQPSGGALTSGRAGVGVLSGAGGLDTWEGGDLGAGPAPPDLRVGYNPAAVLA